MGLEFCFAGSKLQSRHEVAPPLIPLLFKSPVCLQLRDEVDVKPLARSIGMQSCNVLHTVSVKENQANFKALNLVLNMVKPKFSSLLRRVSKVLKFAK
ncbi:hypothetical protein CCC13826_0878 [Campylobacter concisus 13826]|uniref:Uncharacterized protein n=1 Tax=Campylobacter concisus (strain 13826) TaxID=360104 RepID=A8Z6H7_CAMC1|nr:hypothetical protein CCC13826_0878 [Campylobacter concisus 13826]